MKALVDECNSGLECQSGKPCRFLVTLPFPPDGKPSLTEFYKKNGFRQGHKEMFLEIKGEYVPRDIPDYDPLLGDLDRTIILYNPACEWGYFYAFKVEERIHEMDPDQLVEIYNIWERPEEYKKHGGGWMLIAAGILVNRKVPENPFIFWVDREAFLRNVEEAMRQ